MLASHSHLLIKDIFETAYWKNSTEKDRGVLEGWLIGTAGAMRYRLPDNLPPDTLAITYAYGYLLGTVHPNGEITFQFEQVTEDNVPPDISSRYTKKLIDTCFLANRDNTPHPPEPSCNEK